MRPLLERLYHVCLEGNPQLNYFLITIAFWALTGPLHAAGRDPASVIAALWVMNRPNRPCALGTSITQRRQCAYSSSSLGTFFALAPLFAAKAQSRALKLLLSPGPRLYGDPNWNRKILIGQFTPLSNRGGI